MLYHLTLYCQRLDQNEDSFIISNENVRNQINFKELYRQGITSSQLLDWFAPIDIAEEYEINGEDSDAIFYDCSSPWFGSTCQYRLLSQERPSFSSLVRYIFVRRQSPSSDINFHVGSMYPYLKNCIRGPSPMCLDWREICNGIADCVYGEDEELCYLLETSEYSTNEFRCRDSTQCIPQAFIKDSEDSFDCLDGTDEIPRPRAISLEHCMLLPAFECEELAFGYRHEFSCGDGQINRFLIPRFFDFCENLRDKYMTITLFTSFDYISNLACQQFFICLIRPAIKSVFFLIYEIKLIVNFFVNIVHYKELVFRNIQ
jgi:hypothetical protein